MSDAQVARWKGCCCAICASCAIDAQSMSESMPALGVAFEGKGMAKRSKDIAAIDVQLMCNMLPQV